MGPPEGLPDYKPTGQVTFAVGGLVLHAPIGEDGDIVVSVPVLEPGLYEWVWRYEGNCQPWTGCGVLEVVEPP